jgi:hypothetical protein
VTGEHGETDVAGRNSAPRNRREVIAAFEDVWNRSSDQQERAIDLSRLAG